MLKKADIRDNHTDSVRIDRFLAIIIPVVPIIPANSYIHKMGWELTTDASGEVQLSSSVLLPSIELLSHFEGDLMERLSLLNTLNKPTSLL